MGGGGNVGENGSSGSAHVCVYVCEEDLFGFEFVSMCACVCGVGSKMILTIYIFI